MTPNTPTDTIEILLLILVVAQSLTAIVLLGLGVEFSARLDRIDLALDLALDRSAKAEAAEAELDGKLELVERVSVPVPKARGAQ